MTKKITINPVGFLIWVWVWISFGFLRAFNLILVVLLHEMGHFLVAKKLGYDVGKFALSPYGVELNCRGERFVQNDELLIAFAGPAVNFVTALLAVGVWWIFPEFYFVSQSFVEGSLVLCLFNLLPAYPLDGARIFCNLSQKFASEKLAKKLTIFVNIMLSILFLALFVASIFLSFNPSLLAVFVFLLGGVLDLKQESQYHRINILCKGQKRFEKLDFCVIDKEVKLAELLKKMQTRKTYVFVLFLDNGKIFNISEKMAINMLKYFSPETKIEEIIKQQ